MKAFSFVLLATVCQWCFAQQVNWNSGVVVLANGDVKKGEIFYQNPELVLFRQGGTVTVYPAHQAQSFRYYDDREGINRNFSTLSFSSGQKLAHRFCEVVVWGPVGVVRKLKSYALRGNFSKPQTEDFEYFIQFHSSLLPINRFRTKVYPSLIAQSGKELDHFIKLHRLNPNYSADAIKIIREFNQAAVATVSLAGL